MRLSRLEWAVVLGVAGLGFAAWGVAFLVGFVPMLVIGYRIGQRPR